MLFFRFCFYSPFCHTDIQSNFVDTKPTHHQATYIPVSNALLKTKFPPTPTNKTARSTPKRTVFRRNAPFAPFNISNTISSTSVRHKRDLLNASEPLPFEETRPLETPDIRGSIATNSTAETSESMLKPQFTVVDNATESDSHPKFHVTYWMFYPYSQVSNLHYFLYEIRIFWCKSILYSLYNLGKIHLYAQPRPIRKSTHTATVWYLFGH